MTVDFENRIWTKLIKITVKFRASLYQQPSIETQHQLSNEQRNQMNVTPFEEEVPRRRRRRLPRVVDRGTWKAAK